MYVSCDNPAIRELIKSIVVAVRANGGFIHPGVELIEESGHMSIFCREMGGASALFHLPPEALLPIEDAEWSDINGDIIAARYANEMDQHRTFLLSRLIDLYNETGKLKWFKETSPRYALGSEATVRHAIALIRPHMAVIEKVAAKAFLKSRVFSIPLSYAGLGGKSVLMPLVDLLNHHPVGGSFSLNENGIGVTLVSPNGDAECFVQYRNHLDPLTIAWEFCYAEEKSPFATSAPVSVLIGELGNITIDCRSMKSNVSLDLPAVKFSDDGLSFSHLIVNRWDPEKSRINLKLGIAAQCKRKGIPAERVDQLCEDAVLAICTANVNLLLHLENKIRALDTEVPAARVLLRACEIQRRNLTDVATMTCSQ